MNQVNTLNLLIFSYSIRIQNIPRGIYLPDINASILDMKKEISNKQRVIGYMFKM